MIRLLKVRNRGRRLRPCLVLFPDLRPGDANSDGHVDFNDLLIVAQNYGSTSGAVWDTGDFNDDGGVNFNDLLTLSQNYGEPNFNLNSNFDSDWTYAQSLIPEPTTLGLLAFSFVLLRRKM